MISTRKGNIIFAAVFIFVSTVVLTPEGSAQQPPEQLRAPPLLQQRLFGPHGPRKGLLAQQRLLAQKRVQTQKPAVRSTGQDKCVPNCDELLAKVRQQGLMGVMVGLAVPNLPDATRVPKEKRVAVNRERELAIGQVQDRVLQRMHAHKIQSVRKFKLTPDMSMTVDATALERLIADPEVIHIHEGQILRLMLSQSGPLIGATQAWANGFSGAGYTIAILDSGVDSSHPFLSGKTVLEACYSGGSPGLTALCPGGQTTAVGPGAAAPCSFLGCDHGTHVAGIAAGAGPTFSGIAKDVQIIAVQVVSYDPVLNDIAISELDIKAALDYVGTTAAANNVVAVNLSLGGGAYTAPCDEDPTWTPVKESIDVLRNLGVATVAASGNNSCGLSGCVNAMSAPACISTAISVGATTKLDTVPPYSNSALFLNLLAPGGDLSGGAGDIYSSVPGGNFGYKAGTSMAAPHVAGAFAVLKQQSPTAAVGDLLSTLENTGAQVLDSRNNVRKPRIQLSNPPWVARYTGGFSSVPGSIGTDSSGNVYVTGDSCRDAPVDDYCLHTDYATVKYSPTGAQQWAARFSSGGDGYGIATALAVDATGNVYVTGYVCQALENPPGLDCTHTDIVTVKYDTNGSQLWVAAFNGGDHSWGYAITLDGSGNVYVTGSSCSGPDCANSGPIFLSTTVKYSSNGSQLWVAQSVGPNELNFAIAIAVDSSGNVYVTGGSLLNYYQGGVVDGVATTVKYGPTGNQLWMTSYGNNTFGAKLAVDSSGNVYVTGSGNTELAPFTVKYGPNGNQLWVVGGVAGGGDIALDASGNVYITGTSYIPSGNGYDFVTAKFDQNGNQLWVTSYVSTIGDDVATRLAVDSSGNVYVTGTVCTELEPSLLACAAFDYMTLKYGPNGAQAWLARHRAGTFSYGSLGLSPSQLRPTLAVRGGSVYVTGSSCLDISYCPDSDYVTLKYTP